MEKKNISFVNLGDHSVEDLANVIKEIKPVILLTSIEVIVRPDVQTVLKKTRIKINYIAIDEAQVILKVCINNSSAHNIFESLLIFQCFLALFPQVVNPVSGWLNIRPFDDEDTWLFLRAVYNAPLLLVSATLGEEDLQQVCKVVGLHRKDLVTVWKLPNRPNIFQAREILPKALTIKLGLSPYLWLLISPSNMSRVLAPLLPLLCSARKLKMQIFCHKKEVMSDVGKLNGVAKF